MKNGMQVAPLFIFASVPRICEEFFDLSTIIVRSVAHRFIGHSELNTPNKVKIEQALKVKTVLCRLMFKGMLMNETLFDERHMTETPTINIEGLGVVNVSDEVPKWIDNELTQQHRVRQLVKSSFLSNLSGLAEKLERKQITEEHDPLT